MNRYGKENCKTEECYKAGTHLESNQNNHEDKNTMNELNQEYIDKDKNDHHGFIFNDTDTQIEIT